MNSRPDNNEKRMDTPLKMIKTLHLSNYLCSISIRPKNSSNYSNAALFSTALHIQDRAAVARVLQRSAAAVIRPLCSSAADVVTCPACSRWRRPVDPHEPYTPPSVHSTSCNMPSLLRHLSTWHCQHLLLSAILRCCCWATGGHHCWSISPAHTALSSKPAACCICSQTDREIDAQYVTAHWTPVSDTASRQHLCSAASHQLTVLPHRRVTYGGRAFTVVGPSTWKSQLKHLREPSYSTSVSDCLLRTLLL